MLNMPILGCLISIHNSDIEVLFILPGNFINISSFNDEYVSSIFRVSECMILIT